MFALVGDRLHLLALAVTLQPPAGQSIRPAPLANSPMLRHALFPVEAAAYGISYAFLQHSIRSPQPLDPEWTWHAITREMPRGTDWIRTGWPLKPLRKLVIHAKMKQDHVLGISAHYDVSNDFYKLWLDRKYMFYTCADFHTPQDTIEDAQQHKADFILKLIDPQPGDKIMELGCGWGPMLKRIYEATGERENLFGLTLSHLGLVAAIVVLVLVGSLADHNARPVEAILLAIFLSTFSVAVFVLLLGLPLQVWPDLQALGLAQ